MSKKKNWLDKKRREPGGFAALPHCLLESQVYIGLSAYAVKLLNDMLAQYKGFNNGDLCITWSMMHKRGWKSPGTLDSARKELLAAGIIILSRFGLRRRANLYALTFYAIDECNGKLDINATEKPPSTWRENEPIRPLKIKKGNTPTVLKDPGLIRQPYNPDEKISNFNTPTVSKRPFSQFI